MRKQRKTTRAVFTAMFVIALASLGLAGSAQAKLVEPFIKFQYCPWHNAEVARCVYATTNSGEVKLGNKTVPIEKPVVLQGGISEPNETTKFSTFFEPTNKITLSKAAQNVPGGLAGIVPEASSPPLVKALIKFFFENKITGLTSTLELAKPASEIKMSEDHLARREGVALKLPVKVHLENPFLGKSCYVGSSTSPIWWELTTFKTSPPAPNTSIEGASGKITFLEEGLILQLNGTKLVDNAWSAPGASGCGGILGFLVNPIINSQLGSTTAGHNTAILNNTIEITTPFALEYIEEENP
jgi:hypothetical protein